MKVTIGDLTYAYEDKLITKMDLIIQRVTKGKMEQNAFMANHGLPGEGKSNASFAEALYFKYKTRRSVHIFMRLKDVIEYSQKNEKKIIVWDEPSLDSLNSDQLTSIVKDLIRLINTARIKRHITIINLTRFWRFPRDLIEDTCLGFLNLNSKNGKDAGRFLYIRGKYLSKLREEYDKTKRKIYGKLKSFGGRMPYIRPDDFVKCGFYVNGKPNATYDDYNRAKEQGIESIGDGKKKEKEISTARLWEIRLKLGKIKKFPIESKEELAGLLGIASNRLREWAKRKDKEEEEGFQSNKAKNTLESDTYHIENDGFEPSPPNEHTDTMAPSLIDDNSKEEQPNSNKKMEDNQLIADNLIQKETEEEL
jgi:hypothetical protein